MLWKYQRPVSTSVALCINMFEPNEDTCCQYMSLEVIQISTHNQLKGVFKMNPRVGGSNLMVMTWRHLLSLSNCDVIRVFGHVVLDHGNTERRVCWESLTAAPHHFDILALICMQCLGRWSEEWLTYSHADDCMGTIYDHQMVLLMLRTLYWTYRGDRTSVYSLYVYK